jgi:hypothetical protein
LFFGFGGGGGGGGVWGGGGALPGVEVLIRKVLGPFKDRKKEVDCKML